MITSAMSIKMGMNKLHRVHEHSLKNVQYTQTHVTTNILLSDNLRHSYSIHSMMIFPQSTLPPPTISLYSRSGMP